MRTSLFQINEDIFQTRNIMEQSRAWEISEGQKVHYLYATIKSTTAKNLSLQDVLLCHLFYLIHISHFLEQMPYLF